ncbi:hypothetical protein ACFFWC_11540 [Plantactinospora siamensis]|uniref:Uncharacterized protein n=1 Tax=Plantactinospora siamensis TaxID=555372 RepID=A0ABV6NZZ3_9ACTN
MAVRRGFANLVATLAVVAFGLGVIWLFGIEDSSRFWGLLVAILAVVAFFWAAFSQRSRT